jgi:AcrR family transcriptional regulator
MLAEVKINPREKIFLTATRMFRETGFSATSMRNISKELGIEAASLYSHIQSKEEILREICFRLAAEFFEVLRTLETSEEGPEEKLKTLINEHIKVLTRDTNASAVFLNEWRHLSEPFHSRFMDMRQKYEHAFRSILKEGIRLGKFKAADEKFMALTILSALNWTHTWYSPEGKMSPEQISDQLYSIILNGIKN